MLLALPALAVDICSGGNPAERGVTCIVDSDTGWEDGHYGRELVTITLADGRDAGEVLIEEGLSRRWPNDGKPWCD